MQTGVIEPGVTNDEDWLLSMQVLDGSAGLDLDAYTISLSVLDSDGGQVLSGSTDTGEIVKSDDDDGVTSIFTITFRAASMAGLLPGNYTVGIRMTDGTSTTQLFLGSMPILEGGF